MKEGTIERGRNKIKYKIYKRSKKNIILKITYSGCVEVSIPKRSPYRIGEEIIRGNFEKIHSKVTERKALEEKKQKNRYLKVLGEDFFKGEREAEEILLTEGKKVYEEMIKKWIPKIGISPEKVRIKNMKTAWGICYSNKNITLNLKLIQMDIKIVEYVIVHELCHLHHMNHSKEFWRLVETHLPKFREERRKLKFLQKEENYFI